jgi:hypothetical protein
MECIASGMTRSGHLLDGTPDKIPWMEPSRIGTPLFVPRPSKRQPNRPRSEGPGPASASTPRTRFGGAPGIFLLTARVVESCALICVAVFAAGSLHSHRRNQSSGPLGLEIRPPPLASEQEGARIGVSSISALPPCELPLPRGRTKG